MLSWNKPENCGILSHHSNSKTNVLTTFQVHNLLTGMLLMSFFIQKKINVAKMARKTPLSSESSPLQFLALA